MPLTAAALQKRAKKIRLIAMDVDGVLTGGEIIVLESGEEVKMWHAQDRLILAILRESNNPLIIAWITGRSSKTVAWSAKDLGISHLAQGCKDKKSELNRLVQQHKLSLDEVAYIGDDLIDLPVLKAVGFAASPLDATSDVKKHAHYISPLRGGRGVARDVIEYILKAQKKWDLIVAPFIS